MRPGRRVLALAAAIASAPAFSSLACGSSEPRAEPPVPMLPDLDQVAPYRLDGNTRSGPRGQRFLLGFGSAVVNIGRGPLLVEGRRGSRRTKLMIAAQLVRWSNGSTTRQPRVGRLRYVHSADHSHWHLMRFERYELRRASDGVLVRPDRKTGFCLGDRFDRDPDKRLEHEPAKAVWTHRCGVRKPRLLRVREGISVGFGDDYDPHVEGQYVELTNLPPGRYELVHRVNADRRLRETNYGNNASSLLFELRWPRGTTGSPSIDVLARCPDTDRCRER